MAQALSTERVEAWFRYVEQELARLGAPAPPAALPKLEIPFKWDFRTVTLDRRGSVFVAFGEVFPSTPVVVGAIETQLGSFLEQRLTAPLVTLPRVYIPRVVIPAVRLMRVDMPTLKAPEFPTPATTPWGNQVATDIINRCPGIDIPYIGSVTSFFCTWIGEVLKLALNALWGLYYSSRGDWGAISSVVAGGVYDQMRASWQDFLDNQVNPAFDEAEAATNRTIGSVESGLNNTIRAVQTGLNDSIGNMQSGMNGIITTAEEDIQEGLNSIIDILYDGLGFLPTGDGKFPLVTPALISRKTTTGFQVESPRAGSRLNYVAFSIPGV